MNKHIISKPLLKYIIVFITLIAAEFIALTSVALIPKSALRDNITKSADYLCDNKVFFYANQNDPSSKIDRYADSILLNIAYNYDHKHPFPSVMSSSYYYDETKNENVNLKTAVTDNPKPTLEYSRYWHGSILIIRPLLILFNIEQIYIMNYIILFSLLGMLIFSIYKHIGKGAAFSFIVTCIMVSIWYVPMSLEYTWTMFIMLVSSIVCLHKLRNNHSNFLIFFFAIGNITAYVDFLTTETLTLLMPMILIIIHSHINSKTEGVLNASKRYISYGLSWLSAYLLTWLAKWSLASIILQENVFNTALNQATYRSIGATENVSGITESLSACARNLGCIFPFVLSKERALLLISIFSFIILSIVYLIHKEKCVTNYLLLCIAFVPYVRYFVLGNHSYLHYFFTYRAQMTTLFCIGLVLVYGSDQAMLTKEWSKIWKKKKTKKKSN